MERTKRNAQGATWAHETGEGGQPYAPIIAQSSLSMQPDQTPPPAWELPDLVTSADLEGIAWEYINETIACLDAARQHMDLAREIES